MTPVSRGVSNHLRFIWGLLSVGLLLMLGCGGLTRGDQALLAKALSDQLQRESYSTVGASYDPKQVALAQQSGLSNNDVAGVMLGLQSSLTGHFARDANFMPPSNLMSAINGGEGLASNAGDRLGDWLVRRGRDQVMSQLQDFLIKRSTGSLEQLLKAAGENGIEYGFFSGAGTLWFRDSQTGAYITITFADYGGRQMLIVIQGSAAKKSHHKYQRMTRFELSIDQVDLWRDQQASLPENNPEQCCRPSPIRLQVVSSLEPDDLLSSPPGVGPNAFIGQDQTVNYTIRIESLEPAPDLDVTVVAKLSQAFDMGSVLLGPTSHPGAMSVEVTESNNTITWSFKDIRLPSNGEPPGGEGWVQFSAEPRQNAPSGTPLTTQAAIRFGFNPAIETNKVAYALDAGTPSTQIEDIDPVQYSSSFPVAWTGSDEPGGSGIRDIVLMVSKDGGPFQVLSDASAQPLMFQGEPGSTYGFATASIDRVGHSEAVPNQPDVLVTVGQPFTFSAGLHLVGVPLAPEASTLDSSVSSWTAWEETEQAYSVFHAEDNGNLAPGSGSWASFEEKTTFYIAGQPVPGDQPYSIDLRPGWNLIANPFLESIPWSLENIQVIAGGEQKTLKGAQAEGWTEDFAWGWNGNYYGLVYDSAVLPGVASQLEPFRGYWVQAYRDLILVLPPPLQQQ